MLKYREIQQNQMEKMGTNNKGRQKCKNQFGFIILAIICQEMQWKKTFQKQQQQQNRKYE